jgi:hypothetical protein
MIEGWRSALLTVGPNARTDVRLEDVFLQSVGEEQWRVLNRTRPAEDVTALLGFVERRGGVYEATVLTLPGTVTRHSNQDAARRRFCDPRFEAAGALRGWNAP